jgi:hypothetical protein
MDNMLFPDFDDIFQIVEEYYYFDHSHLTFDQAIERFEKGLALLKMIKGFEDDEDLNLIISGFELTIKELKEKYAEVQHQEKHKLSIKEFKSLTKQERIKHLHEWGILLTECFVTSNFIHGKIKWVLYWVNNFYAEEWIFPDADQAFMVTAFTDENSLDPYLSAMDLENLLAKK